MSEQLFSRQSVYFLFLIVFFVPTFLNCSDVTNVNMSSKDMESFLEYHFHTYFDVNDPVQVAHAIELRNEIIANCVAKKIIAVPLHYHYDPEKPVLERKFRETICNSKNLLLEMM